MGILKNKLAKMLREMANKVAPEPLGILVGYTDLDGTRWNRAGEPFTEAELATCKSFISFGPRLTPEERTLDLEAGILRGQIEINPGPDFPNDMSKRAVEERWRTACRALPGEEGYIKNKMDLYSERLAEEADADRARKGYRPPRDLPSMPPGSAGEN